MVADGGRSGRGHGLSDRRSRPTHHAVPEATYGLDHRQTPQAQ
jgi:hypothetical protein